jgi:TonB family protein
MTRSVILILSLIAFASTIVRGDTRGRCVAIYAPQPQYPSSSTGQRPEGEGLFVCHINLSTGLVTSVSVAKSTGYAILDKAAVDSLKRWKFKPGTCGRAVKIPLGFWHHLPQT